MCNLIVFLLVSLPDAGDLSLSLLLTSQKPPTGNSPGTSPEVFPGPGPSHHPLTLHSSPPEPLASLPHPCLHRQFLLSRPPPLTHSLQCPPDHHSPLATPNDSCPTLCLLPLADGQSELLTLCGEGRLVWFTWGPARPGSLPMLAQR